MQLAGEAVLPLFFLVPSLFLRSLQEHNNLSVVHSMPIYCSILAQATAAEDFQGKSIKSEENRA